MERRVYEHRVVSFRYNYRYKKIVIIMTVPGKIIEIIINIFDKCSASIIFYGKLATTP